MINTQKISRFLGLKYEAKAEKFLNRQGLKSLTRNFSSRYGEIDLIMTQKDILVFVEVRARQNQNFGTALETVNYAKQVRIITTAKYFLQTEPNLDYQAIRFDVVGINTEISWVQNAFTIDE